MHDSSYPQQAAALIKKTLGTFQPRMGLILGSGLGILAEQVENAHVFNYADLPGFPVSTIQGHAGKLIVGTLNQFPVACLQGRAHLYEGASAEKIKTLIRTLKLIGCEGILITNASGSLHQEMGPGNLMMITDHINFQGSNPLIGPNDDEYGPRFVSMDKAYDPNLQTLLRQAADTANLKLAQGIYVATTGPAFETPAEINAFRLWGASAVGMSTVSEVIIARHCGLKVAAIAAITNLAAGMSDEILSHEGTLQYAKVASQAMATLIKSFFERLQEKKDK